MAHSSEAPFPQLRAGYLRAIARAWRDREYEARLLASASEPRGALRMLEEDFGFHFPFDVRFVVDHRTRPVWDPVSTRGWVGSEDAMVIHLPRAPDDAADGAGIIAKYIQEFPTLLGKSSDVGAEAAVPDTFAEFGLTTGRVLARSWVNPAFADQLFGSSDARQLIEDVMDCLVPWNFKTKFVRYDAAPSEDDAYWASFPRNTVCVHLPKPPRARDGMSALELQPIALTSYNDTGAQYPFTCG